MDRRTTAIAAALSLLPLWQTLLLGSTTALTTAAVVLQAPAAHAQRADEFTNRGIIKWKGGDYQGAIADYSKAIELNSQDAFAYNLRGLVKYKLQDYQGAISDYSSAIEINPQRAHSYANRGVAKGVAGDLVGACADWRKAAGFGLEDASGWVSKQCH